MDLEFRVLGTASKSALVHANSWHLEPLFHPDHIVGFQDDPHKARGKPETKPLLLDMEGHRDGQETSRYYGGLKNQNRVWGF